MKIAFVYNLKPKGTDRTTSEGEKHAEYDTPETIEGIKKAIEANGFEVLMVEAGENTYDLLKENKETIDLIFNFSEAISDGADRRAHLPAVAEILTIPYTGPTPLSAGLILDKARAKMTWNCSGVPTPPFQLFETGKELLKNDLFFPLIVKPVAEGSSIGIRDNCVVEKESDLQERVKEITSKFKQPALVEKYLEGREFTVGMIGNGKDLEVLPIAEVNFDAFPKGARRIDSYEAKWVWDDPNNPIEAVFCPAQIGEIIKKEIETIAKRAFETIGCRDWARIDMRQDKNGNVYVLEINSPAGLLPDPKENSRLPLMAKTAGMSFEELIGKIIRAALKRYGKLEINTKS